MSGNKMVVGTYGRVCERPTWIEDHSATNSESREVAEDRERRRATGDAIPRERSIWSSARQHDPTRVHSSARSVDVGG